MSVPTSISGMTLFPNGIGQGITFIIGGAAGDHTVTGIKTTDKLLAVQAIGFAAGVPNSVTGLLSEFTISADDTINNTGGTSTANKILAITVAVGPGR